MQKKSKPVLYPLPINLPDDIGSMTINNLINSEDTEFSKKGNKISIKRATDIGIATLEIESYDTGRKTITQSTVPHLSKKADYRDDIIEMKKSGMRNKDIAFKLGISESYVTKLSKKKS